MDAVKRKYPDVDVGYSWVALIAASFIYMITIGTSKCYGILFTELQKSYLSGSGNTASVGSVRMFVVSMTSPFANYLCVEKSFRKVMFIGGLLFGSSFLLSSFVHKMDLMYITYSIIGGIGNGMNSGPSNTIVSFFFERRRSLANGVVIGGSAIGSLLLPQLYRYLFDTYGLHGGLLVLSGVSFNICVTACLLRQPSMLVQNRKRQKFLPDSTLSDKSSVLAKMKYNLKRIFKFDSKLIRNKSFLLLVIIFGIIFVPHTALYFMIPAHIEALELGKQNAATAISIVGISGIIGLLAFGWFLDLKIISPKLMFVISVMTGGICTILVPLMYDIYHLWIYAAIIGLFPGSITALFSLILIEEFGVKQLPAAYGVMAVFRAVPTVLGQYLLGMLEDVTGSWNASFIVLGAVLIFCGIVMFVLWYRSRIKHGNRAETTDRNQAETTDKNQAETTDRNQAETTDRNQAETTDKNRAETTDRNQAETTDRNQAETTDRNQAETTDKNQAETTDKNHAETTDRNQAETTDRNQAETTDKNRAESTDRNQAETTDRNRVETTDRNKKRIDAHSKEHETSLCFNRDPK